jgi:hypothetical protein
MTDFSQINVPRQGDLKEGDIYSILYYIYKNFISGTLVVNAENVEKKMFIEDRKIVFAASNGKEDALGDYLLRNNLIDKDIYHKTGQYMEKNNKRFGRALIELGYFNYEQLWTWIPNHLQAIVFSFFDIKSGAYQIVTDAEKQEENIVLDLDILSVIVEGMRRFESKSFLGKKFADIEHLYVTDSRNMTQLDLKPYEIHVFDLVRRGPQLKDILKRSELLEFDTLRLLNLFLILEIISTRQNVKTKRKPGISQEKESWLENRGINASTFNSFEEALRYYNMKYEIIYKVMLKEIGPISLSLLLKAVEDIMENLPSYLRKIQLNPDGTINEELILKSVWYHDFDEHIGEFLRGLEEILYTEIYAVKKHLGVEYEQQVLKWIDGIGN